MTTRLRYRRVAHWRGKRSGGSGTAAAGFAVANQSFAFGTKTPVNTGAFKFSASSGTIESIGSLTGTNAGHFQASLSGGIVSITPSSAGDTADLNLGPYSLTLPCYSGPGQTGTQINVPLSISTLVAKSVATYAEWMTALNHSSVAYGDEILLRSGVYNDGGFSSPDFRRSVVPTGTFTPPSLIDANHPDKGSDPDTGTYVVSKPHAGASPVVRHLRDNNVNGGNVGFRFTGLAFERPWGLAEGVQQTVGKTMFSGDSSPTDTCIDNCTFLSTLSEGSEVTTNDPPEINSAILLNGSNNIVRDNTITGAHVGLTVNGSNCETIGNTMTKVWADAATLGKPGSGHLYAWNVIYDKMMHDAALGFHSDFVQNNDVNSTGDWAGVRIVCNRHWVGEGRSGFQGGQLYFGDDLNVAYRYTNLVVAGNMGLGELSNAVLYKHCGAGCQLRNNTALGGTFKLQSAEDSRMRDNLGEGFSDQNPLGTNDLGNNVTISSLDYSTYFANYQARSNDDIKDDLALNSGTDAFNNKIGAHQALIDWVNREHDFPWDENVSVGDFSDQTGVTTSTLVESDKITVTGIDTTGANLTTLTPSGVLLHSPTGHDFKIFESDGTTLIRDWAATDTIVTGHSSIQVQMRLTSSGSAATEIVAEIDIGNKTVDWSVTTA